MHFSPATATGPMRGHIGAYFAVTFARNSIGKLFLIHLVPILHAESIVML